MARRRVHDSGEMPAGLAIGLAAALHGIGLAALSHYRVVGEDAPPAVAATPIDVTLVPAEVETVVHSDPAPPTVRSTPARSTPRPWAPRPDRVGPPPDGEAGPEEGAQSADAWSSEPPEAESAAPSERPRRAVELGLDGWVTRRILLDGMRKRKTAQRPSIGLLREGLAARDAARGLARSSVAVTAAVRAAQRHAPREGIALFDVRSDSLGAVQSVTLVSFGANEQHWKNVAAYLEKLLRSRRLRTAKGSKGSLARIRVERGSTAKDLAKRGRLSRRPALGQQRTPTDRDVDESTRTSLEPGKLTPTLGISLTSGGSHPTRVALVFERSL